MDCILTEIAETKSPKIVVAMRDQDKIPDYVTHVIALSEDKKVTYSGPVDGYRVPEKAVVKPEISPKKATKIGDVLVDIKNLNIVYNRNDIPTPVLQNLSWTIREGERWALSGPNGSGKTTLLSTILGDHPKSWANDIVIFGRQRGTGESIFDIQEQIGHVSPELYLHFPGYQSTKRAVSTGFNGNFQALGNSALAADPAKETRIAELLQDFGLSEQAETPFNQLSSGQQRLVLFLRAIVKPDVKLIVLDEPFQGMDARMIEQCQEWLNTKLGENQAIVFISHYITEWPKCLTHHIALTGSGGSPDLKRL